MEENEKSWNPLTTEEVSFLFSGAPFPALVAGGIALELAVGQSIREHHSDMDVFLLRPDHLVVREWLADWDCWVADPPGSLRVWPLGQEFGTKVHDIWCRRSSDDDWRVQLMLDEVDLSGN